MKFNLPWMKKKKPNRPHELHYHPAEEPLLSSKQAQKIASSFQKINAQHGFRIFVAGGSRDGDDPVYKEAAYRLGLEIAKVGFRLDFGLSGRGIMGAVAKGVLSGLAAQNKDIIPIQGITTKEYLALTQQNEIVNQIKEVIVAHTLEERKNRLLNADFIIFAPGGIGTLDELVYDCVAMQDGFLPLKPFMVFNVNGYYHHLLEYLKEIHLKGFASQTPFIVVDNSTEAGIAFEVLKYRYKTPPKKEDIFTLVEKIIYELPYTLEIKQAHPERRISAILKKIDDTQKNGSQKAILALAADIEKAYLRKEIDRMYSRLEKAGRDTAAVSEKLSGLKKQRSKAGGCSL